MSLVRFEKNSTRFVELVFDDEIDCEVAFDDLQLFLGGKTLTKSRFYTKIIRMKLPIGSLRRWVRAGLNL